MPQDTLKVPELSLIILIGSTGAGKSTFARRLFKPTEIVSSDACRGLVADDENDQSASKDAFELLHYLVAKRLKRGLLTVVDATNVQEEGRKPLVALARQYHVLPVAIVLDVPDAVAQERNAQRPDRRHLGRHVIASHRQQLRRSLRNLRQEGFRHIHHLRNVGEIDAIQSITRDRLYNNRQEETGPFDIIGDVHGCYEELRALLEKLGYQITEEPITDVRDLGVRVTPPPGPLPSGRGGAERQQTADSGQEDMVDATGTTSQLSGSPSPGGEGAGGWGHRKAVFLGDLVDRGPASPQVLRLVMSMVRDGSALCVPGNHDIKLLRHLNGKNVTINHGLAETLAQLEPEPEAFKSEVRRFLDGLVSHYVLDGGKLVVAHAGLTEEMQGRGSGAVRAFALFGESTGEIDEFGLPVRYEWAREYRGRAMVAFGHTPVPDAEWLNNTIDLDTGCVFGGRLTALRYPERELVAVPAARVYCEPARPLNYKQLLAASSQLLASSPDGENQNEKLTASSYQLEAELDIRDVTGKQFIETRLMRGITIREDNAVAALEVMSRFALHPKWLLYLPPTMSPTETSALPDLLEHPAEAFDYYKRLGVERVVCEEKHMGSRVVVVLGRDEAAIQRRLGLVGEGIGKVYTRTGRNFFTDAALETAFLARLRDALSTAGFWEKFDTDWVCLDAELLPWSAKAQELVKTQYAAVAAAALAALPQVEAALAEAAARQLDGAEALLARTTARYQGATHYADAYRRYCWPVHSLDDLKLAPFHLLATEGKTYFDRDHAWHMETLRTLALADPGLLRATPYRVVPLSNPAEVEAAIQWWTDLTAAGGEGMVVKPYDFIPQGKGGLLQPALKCRGREYLRIIYGPDYLLPGHLDRLRQRNVKAKRNLALREFALGVEGLERFVAGQPLRRVHQCVFGVLALESEAVDPRL